jgi:hypothetical protein
MPTKLTKAPPRNRTFKMPKKPFKIRVGGVEVTVPITIKGKIPDSVIERAIEAAFLARRSNR